MSQAATPTIGSMVKVPALITLGITIARLLLEFAGAPDWLASREAGGQGAALGISWLPLIFGPYFAMQIARQVEKNGARYKRLAGTLIVYGFAARIPVVLITIFAILGDWDTHYNKFPDNMADASTAKLLGMTLIAQLGFWIFAWTLLSGLITGAIAFAAAGRRPAAPAT